VAGRRQDQAGDRLHALGGFEIVVILFIFAIMGLLFLMVRTAFAPNATQISALRDENAALRACAANASDPALRQCVDQVRKGEPTTNTKPPLITLSEAAGYSFASGRTDVSSAFRGALTDKVIPQLIAAASLHRLDLIEVVGHTDEMAMAEPAEYALAYLSQFGSLDELWAAHADGRARFEGISHRSDRIADDWKTARFAYRPGRSA